MNSDKRKDWVGSAGWKCQTPGMSLPHFSPVLRQNASLSAFGRLLSTCLTLLAGPLAAAPEKLPPLELPVPESALRESRKLTYGVYMNGGKIGWGLDSREPGKFDGKECIVTAMSVNMEMKSLGNTMQVEMIDRQHFDMAPPHRARRIESVQKMDGQERRIILNLKEGSTYAVEITEAGKTRTSPDVTLEHLLTHKTSPEVWAADPSRKPGEAIGLTDFDEDTLTMTATTATLLQEADWIGPGGKIAAWEVQIYEHKLKLGMTARISRLDGNLVNMQMGGMFDIRLEPEAVAKQRSGEQADLFLALAVKSDKKLGRATALSELEIELIAPGDAKTPEFPETVNQSVTRNESGRVTLRVTRGRGKPQPASDTDRAENLKATLRYPADNVEVKKLADKAVAGAIDDADKVKRLLRFTDFHLRDSYEVEALTVMDLLKNRKGECSAHALLFTTVARAAGIPAREAGGWLYMDDTYQAFGGHAWNEVILDGHWVPVDAIFQQTQLDAGHLQIHAGETDGKAIESLAAGLRAKVKSFKKNKN